MQHCFRLGLYRQGLLHDMSKYSLVEFLPGIKYYQGNRSPNEAERTEKGYSAAWLHHKGRNKHHMEYWIDYPGNGKAMEGVEMPLCYVAEMFCDRVAASKTYLKDQYHDGSPWEYYAQRHDHYWRLSRRLEEALEGHNTDNTPKGALKRSANCIAFSGNP